MTGHDGLGNGGPLQPTPHCHRCGYANAPSWPLCMCCGRPMHLCVNAKLRASPRGRRRRRRFRRRFASLRLRRRRTRTARTEDLAELIAAW